MSFFSRGLGQDFWNFRLAQLISLLGDSCGSIALAWWILDKTGSAAEMSSVLAPAMLVKILLLPVCGPIADRFSRKHLILLANLWRFVFSGLITGMVFFDFYHLPLLLLAYTMISVGSALFAAAAGGIVPQLVAREKLQVASQQSEAIDSFGGVAGGIVGGIMVSSAGVFGAFFVDTLSFLLSAGFVGLIKADTRPKKRSAVSTGFTQWKRDFTEGFAILYRIPVLFWLCMVAMFLNLSLAPLGIILPVLAKESRGMPAWFLGGLESSISLGAILGAVCLAVVQRWVRGAWLLVLSIMMMGVGVALLPWVPNALLPITVLFWVGVAGAWANIPLGTQISLSVPDSHRGRVGAIMNFLCTGISPLGVAIAGVVMAAIGLSKFLLGMGIAVVVLTPLILLIPHIREYMAAGHDEAEEFFEKRYPGAFRD